MEKTENMITVHAQAVPPEEITVLREHIWMAVDDHVIDRDSPLVEAIHFILDTLEAGVDITIMTAPSPEDYTLA